MNSVDIANAVGNEIEIPVSTIEQVLNCALDIVTLSLAAGEEVTFRNFGRFRLHRSPAGERRNPRTGEPVWVPEKTTPKFVASAALKARVNGAR